MEKEFVDGMRLEKKVLSGVNGEFEIISVGFKVDDMIAWLQANQNEKGWVNATIKTSQNGKVYAEKYVPKGDPLAPARQAYSPSGHATETDYTQADPYGDKEEIKLEDIPF